MCQSYTFYHICGHVYHKTIIQCPHSIDSLIASDDPPSIYHRVHARHALCVDAPNEIEVMPSTCTMCNEVGIISEWLNHSPEARFDLVRTWKTQLREDRERGAERDVKPKTKQVEKVETKEQAKKYDEHEADVDDASTVSDETMEYISTSDVRSTASSRTSDCTRPPTTSEDAVTAQSDPLELRKRADRLKERLLSVLRSGYGD